MFEQLDTPVAKRFAAKRTRQRETLVEYLGRGHWSAETALLIMAGLDPDRFYAAKGSQRYRSFLPGGFQKKWLSFDGSIRWRDVELQVSEKLRNLQEVFTGDARSPLEWAHVAHRCGHSPNWISSVSRNTKFSGIVQAIKGGSVSKATATATARKAGSKPEKDRTMVVNSVDLSDGTRVKQTAAGIAPQKNPAKVAAGKKSRTGRDDVLVRQGIDEAFKKRPKDQTEFEFKQAMLRKYERLVSGSPKEEGKPKAGTRLIREHARDLFAQPKNVLPAKIKAS